MRTLADFKRAIEVGTKWEGFNYLYNRSMGVREVSKVKSGKFSFRTIRESGEIVDSWMDFPKASEIEFKEGDMVTIYYIDSYTKERKPMMSYKKV